MDKNGVLYENMPESLGRATEGTGETVGSNFRFAKNADTMEDLSILWVDSVPRRTQAIRHTTMRRKPFRTAIPLWAMTC